MAGYLRHITSFTNIGVAIPIPGGINAYNLATDVFDLLRSDDAVRDLSLPDPTTWPAMAPAIDVVFTQFATHVNMPESNTTTVANVLTCFVNYSAADVAFVPLIEARAIHELTHAIRSQIVIAYNAAHAAVAVAPAVVQPFLRVTPEKPPRLRRFKSSALFGMTNSRFCSGYWVEHNLNGGVIVPLYGMYTTKAADGTFLPPINIPAGGMFFKLHHEGGSHPIGEDSYKSRYGFMLDAAGVFEAELKVIYHSGTMVTRGNGHW